MRMIRTAALAAIGALALFITQPANETLADPTSPEDVLINYLGSANNKVTLRYFNPDGPILARVVHFNYCKAQASLPPNWNRATEEHRYLYGAMADGSSGLCAEDPRWQGFGLIIERDAAKGQHFYGLADELDPGRYIISVNFWNGDSAGLHHTDGNHTVLELVELTRSN